MRLLLDTHVLFWSLVDHERMPERFRRLLVEGDHSYHVSAVTGWEIATKVRIGKWPEAAPLLPDLTELVRRSCCQLLDITMAQAELAGSLPLIHRDPFNRLLAAQALDLDIAILTVDPALARLGCKVV